MPRGSENTLHLPGQLYERHVLQKETRDALSDLMNGPYHDRWNIPDGVVWGAQGGAVFDALAGDFMRPVVDSGELRKR